MKTFAETERLILREILPHDVEGLFELDSDPDVHRFLGNTPVENRNQIRDKIDFFKQEYRENGTGRWAIIEKRNNNFIGWAGLKYVKQLINNHINYYDLGYRLIKRYWGQGYATESAIALLTIGFENFNINEIFAMAEIENINSNKILTKLGFEFIETFNHYGKLHNWYRIDKKDWNVKIK